MSTDEFLPPGEHPHDQARNTMPPVDFQLKQLSGDLTWCQEYLAGFLAQRDNEPQLADNELKYLNHSLQKAQQHYARLVELLNSGYQPSSVRH